MVMSKDSNAFGAAKRISTKSDVDFDIKRESDDWGQFDED